MKNGIPTDDHKHQTEATRTVSSEASNFSFSPIDFTNFSARFDGSRGGMITGEFAAFREKQEQARQDKLTPVQIAQQLLMEQLMSEKVDIGGLNLTVGEHVAIVNRIRNDHQMQQQIIDAVTKENPHISRMEAQGGLNSYMRWTDLKANLNRTASEDAEFNRLDSARLTDTTFQTVARYSHEVVNGQHLETEADVKNTHGQEGIEQNISLRTNRSYTSIGNEFQKSASGIPLGAAEGGSIAPEVQLPPVRPNGLDF